MERNVMISELRKRIVGGGGIGQLGMVESV